MTASPHASMVDPVERATSWSTGLDGLHLTGVPLAPEIRLHLASDATLFWARMEAEAGRALSAPFWATAWLGGQALARFVLDHPDVVAGLRVLDLAAGSGVAGIAAALADAAVVTANDIDPCAGAAIEMNARANGVEIIVSCAPMLEQDVDVDVVLAGDVFYNGSMAATVMRCLERASRRGARVLVGDPDRTDLPRARLETLATYRTGLAATLVDAEREWVHVLQLEGRGPAIVH